MVVRRSQHVAVDLLCCRREVYCLLCHSSFLLWLPVLLILLQLPLLLDDPLSLLNLLWRVDTVVVGVELKVGGERLVKQFLVVRQ